MNFTELKEQFASRTLEIKPFIGFINKKIMMDKIIEDVLVEENGIKVVDCLKYEIAFNISLLIHYVGLDISEEDSVVEIFDYCFQNGIFEYVQSKIAENEFDFLKINLRKMIDEEKYKNNSYEAILSKGIIALIAKMPDAKTIEKIINNLPKAINKIKPENLEVLKSLGKIN